MKICVIHLNQIGDLMFSLPLLKALKDAHPGALIHSVVKPPGGAARRLPWWMQSSPSPGTSPGS